MDERWIDEAVRDIDATGPRPGFESELRANLSDSWHGVEHHPSTKDGTAGTPRHRGWWLATAAAVVVALVAGGIAIVNRNDSTTSSPTDTAVTVADPTTPDDGPSTTDDETNEGTGSDRAVVTSGDVEDRTWIITDVDGEPRTYAASFTLGTDGSLTGHDGCNYFGSSARVVDGRLEYTTDEMASTEAECSPPYGGGWIVPAGQLRLVGDGDNLVIVADDGSEFWATDLATVPTLSSADQLVGTWTTAEQLDVTFTPDGSIVLDCATIGTWTFDDVVRTEMDQLAYGDCVLPDGPSLQWTYDDLLGGTPTIRPLPDKSLLIGTDQFGRLLRTADSPDIDDPARNTSVDNPITRPVIDAAYCSPTWASESEPTVVEPNFFTRRSTFPIPIQVLGAPDGDITAPYAVVLRYFDGEQRNEGGETVDVNGTPTQVFVGEYGQGAVNWTLPDGTIGYIRSRGLDADQLTQIARALVPRTDDDPIPGFDVTGALPEGIEPIGESVGPFEVSGASSGCLFDGGLDLQVTLIEGDLVYRFAAGVDFIPLPVLRPVGDDATLAAIPRTTVPDDVLDDVVQAPPEQWAELLVDGAFPADGPATMDLESGSLWGLGVGDAKAAEAIVTAGSQVGPVGADSGWFVTPPRSSDPQEPDCLAGMEQRILWWGDASMAFARDGEGSNDLWSWTVGDVRASGWGDRQQPDPPEPIILEDGTVFTSGVTTTEGIGIGSTVDQFLAAHGGALPLDAAVPEADGARFGVWQSADGPAGNFFVGVMVDADDRIIGIGTTRSFC